MPRLVSLAFALAVPLSLAACTDEDDGPDLTGVYRVDTHARNDTGCTPGAAVADPAFLKFTREELFGQKYFVYVECSDAGITCESGSGIFGLPYSEPVVDGHRARVFTSSNSGPGSDCFLGAVESTATLRGTALTIETRQHETIVPGLTDEECDPDEAQARLEAGTLACSSLETYAATRQ